MLRWVIIIGVIGIVWMLVLQRNLGQVVVNDKSRPTATEVQAQVASSSDDNSSASAPLMTPGKLTLPQERLANRVAPVQEAPIRGEILPQ